MAVIISIAGFAAAILVNLFIPQFADIAFKNYSVWGTGINANNLYCCILLALISVYAADGAISIKNGGKRSAEYKKRAPLRFAAGIALALWDIAGTKLQLLPQPFFPGPADIAGAFLEDGTYIWKNTFYSIRLFSVGFVSGTAAGIATGILSGCFKKAAYWINPVLNICGVVPPVAWMPFALILFPTSFQAAVFLLVICVWFPVASMTEQGITSTPKSQFEAAKTLGASTRCQIFTVAVPHAMPQIFVGITTAEAYAFMNLVMAEMLGQPGGLGYYINASKVWSAYYKIFAAIVVMAVLFSLIKFVIDKIGGYLLRWQKGIVK